MNRIIAIAVLALLLVPMVAACQQTSLDDAKTDFCAKLEAFGTSVDELGQTNATTTIDEFNTSKANVETAWTDLQAASETLEEVQLDETQAAFDSLKQTADGISDDATLASGFETVVTGAQQTKAAVEIINTTVCVAGIGE